MGDLLSWVARLAAWLTISRIGLVARLPGDVLSAIWKLRDLNYPPKLTLDMICDEAYNHTMSQLMGIFNSPTNASRSEYSLAVTGEQVNRTAGFCLIRRIYG